MKPTLSTVMGTDLLVSAARKTEQNCRGLEISSEPLRTTSTSARDVCRELVTRARTSCSAAQSTGISIFSGDQQQELTWLIVDGELSAFAGRRFPRRHSMCDVCFEQRALQLFIQPQRYFQWLTMAGISIQEALVCPLFGTDERVYGTFWMFSHTTDATFSQCDARILTQLSASARQAVQGCHLAPASMAYEYTEGGAPMLNERRRLVHA